VIGYAGFGAAEEEGPARALTSEAVKNVERSEMKLCTLLVAFGLTSLTGTATAQTLSCNLQNYKPVEGITVGQAGNVVTLTWQAEHDQQLRAEFAIRAGQPVVQELAARQANGQWAILGQNLAPDFEVTAGRRRMAALMLRMMKAQGRGTPAAEKFEKWNTFWDAPLAVPGTISATDLPRYPWEITRGTVSYHTTGCTVTSKGERVSVDFSGLTLGIYSGYLQFTAFKGSNLLRQEAIAKTEEPDRAFIYKAGLKGFSITASRDPSTRNL
jgi:hypothetical protein